MFTAVNAGTELLTSGVRLEEAAPNRVLGYSIEGDQHEDRQNSAHGASESAIAPLFSARSSPLQKSTDKSINRIPPPVKRLGSSGIQSSSSNKRARVDK